MKHLTAKRALFSIVLAATLASAAWAADSPADLRRLPQSKRASDRPPVSTVLVPAAVPEKARSAVTAPPTSTATTAAPTATEPGRKQAIIFVGGHAPTGDKAAINSQPVPPGHPVPAIKKTAP